MKPLISVIVPVFNVAEFLDDCIKSLLNQSYENFEILLIDDGSGDKSLEICQNYAKKEPKIRVFSKQNGGQGSARNLGLDNAKGEFICFVDSDDILASGFLDKTFEILKQNNVKMAMCAYAPFVDASEISNVESVKSEVKILNDKEIFKEIFLANPAFGTAVWRNLYHKSIFEKLRFPQNQIYEDVAIAFEIFNNAEKAAFCNEILYFYRLRAGSTTNSFSKRHLQAEISVKNFCEKVVKKYPDLKKLANFAICDSMTSISIMILKDGAKEFYPKITEFLPFLRENFINILKQKNYSKIKKIEMILLSISPKMLNSALKFYQRLRN